MEECKWLVVGFGPSGMMAAKTLADNGEHDTIIVERLSSDVHRRYHSICGEAVSERILSRIGFRPNAVLKEVSSISIEFSGGISIDIPVKGYIVDRNAMLNQLRDECNADFIHASVRSARKTEGGFIVTTNNGDIKCERIIGADGAHSVVRRDIFGSTPEEMIPIVNNIVPGNGGEVLKFIVCERYHGGYRWEFPSSEGFMSVGYPKGTDHIDGIVSKGARCMPIGKLPSVVNGNASIVGDAASLANPLCFGGIGAALLSGRKAAEAMISGKPEKYQSWINHDRMFNSHFMDAHKAFSLWRDSDIIEAMKPFRNGYSIPRGFLAMVKHPSWANIYMACWLGFARGW